MTLHHSKLLFAMACCMTMGLACSATPSASEEERQMPGEGNPSSSHCVREGYALSPAPDSGDCVFPDGTKCIAWQFLRGECGQTWSYCARQGGTLSNVTETRDNLTLSYGRCTLPDGRQCDEYDFVKTKVCNAKK